MCLNKFFFFFFFFNDTATTEIYTLSLHDALRSRCAQDGRWRPHSPRAERTPPLCDRGSDTSGPRSGSHRAFALSSWSLAPGWLSPALMAAEISRDVKLIGFTPRTIRKNS